MEGFGTADCVRDKLHINRRVPLGFLQPCLPWRRCRRAVAGTLSTMQAVLPSLIQSGASRAQCSGADGILPGASHKRYFSGQFAPLRNMTWSRKSLFGTRENQNSSHYSSHMQPGVLEMSGSKRGARDISTGSPRAFNYRVIASDMDGTFLARDHSVPERNIQAVLECIRRGILFLPATGKSRAGAMASVGPLASLLTSNDSHGAPGVYIQGLVVYGLRGELVYQQTLPRETARELVRVQRELRFGALVAYSGDRIVCEERNTYTERLVPYHEPEPDDSHGEAWERLLERPEHEFPIHKMLFVDSVERIRELRPLVEEAVGQATPSISPSNGEFSTTTLDRTRPPLNAPSNQIGEHTSSPVSRQHLVQHTSHGRCVQACPDMLEVLPANANKGDGLRRLLEHLGIRAEEVVAIGDAENDIEMIRYAGLGIAVGNALPILKDAADVVLDVTNDDAAVAAAVERFFLIHSTT